MLLKIIIAGRAALAKQLIPCCLPISFFAISVMSPMLKAEDARLTLDTLVVPTTSFYQNGQPVKFALYGFLEFQTLDQLFAYIDAQAGRWQFASATEREEFADRLLERGVESRLISMTDERPLEALIRFHFDGVYLAGYGKGKMNFISREFQQLMLEIWKVKFLRMKRFGEVIRSTRGVKLYHYLNDADPPDIPLAIYVRFLNQIRDLAIEQERKTSGRFK